MKGLNRILIRKRVEGKNNYIINPKDVTSTLNPAYSKKIELSDHEKITIAIHECGHAIMALCYPAVGKITEIEISQIIPGALGFVKRTKPENDKSMTRDQFRMLCRILFGGKAAEEVVFGDGNHSIGVAADLRNATQIVEAMHYSYGMSESGIVPSENPSHSIRTRIENEISNLLAAEYNATKQIISRNLKLLRRMSEDLLKSESINDVSMYTPVEISKNDPLYLGVKNIKSLEEAFED
jgi:ATP-dependent Zn protease